MTKFPDRVKKSLLTLWSCSDEVSRSCQEESADPVVSDEVSRSCQEESADPVVSDEVSRSCQEKSADPVVMQ